MIASETATTAGSGRLDHVVAELRLALAPQLAVADGQLRDLRDDGMTKAVGDGRPEHGAVGVVPLLPKNDEVGALALERGRERPRGRDEVRSGRGVVRDQDGAVGAHRERLAQRVERSRRAHRNEDDLALTVCFLDLQRLLDGLCVEMVQRPLAGAVKSFRIRVDALVDSRVGDFFDTDRDLHRQGL